MVALQAEGVPGDFAVTSKPPTKRQLEVLRFVAKNIATRGFVPTFREIGDHFGFRSAHAGADHLRRLAAKGLVRSHGHTYQARRTTITQAGYAVLASLGAEGMPSRTPAEADPRFKFHPMRRCALCEFCTLKSKCCEKATRLESEVAA
jgi:SOS-response transcriptional repressor LexA